MTKRTESRPVWGELETGTDGGVPPCLPRWGLVSCVEVWKVWVGQWPQVLTPQEATCKVDCSGASMEAAGPACQGNRWGGEGKGGIADGRSPCTNFGFNEIQVWKKVKLVGKQGILFPAVVQDQDGSLLWWCTGISLAQASQRGPHRTPGLEQPPSGGA